MFTFLVPVKGNRAIDNCIASIEAQGLAELEIIVIRNGLSQAEFVACCKVAPNVKHLWLKEANKAKALNLGLKHAQGELVITIDADTVLGDGSIEKILKHFTEPSVQGVSCRLEVGNKQSLLGLWQHYEYAKVFIYTRHCLNRIKADFIMSGACSCYRADALRSLGGFDEATVGEDMELTLRLQKKFPQSLVYDREVVCATQVPESFPRLLRQRDRWQRGALDCYLKHRDLLFNTSYGWLGRAGFPYFFLLEVLGPIWILVGCFGLAKSEFLLGLSLGYCLYVLGFNMLLSFRLNKGRSLWMKQAEPIGVTLVGLCLQVFLALVRLVAMLSFPWRRHIW